MAESDDEKNDVRNVVEDSHVFKNMKQPTPSITHHHQQQYASKWDLVDHNSVSSVVEIDNNNNATGRRNINTNTVPTNDIQHHTVPQTYPLKRTDKFIYDNLYKLEDEQYARVDTLSHQRTTNKPFDTKIVQHKPYGQQNANQLRTTNNQQDINKPPSYATNDNINHTPPKHTNTPKTDILILMDSNRKFINFDNLFVSEKVQVVACGNVANAIQCVTHRNFIVPKSVYIHLGTNDLNQVSPGEYLSALGDLVQRLGDMGCEVFISELLPRKDGNRPLTDKVNHMIRQLVPEGNLIPHPDITHDHLHDDVHLRNNINNGEKLSGTQLLARDFYFKRYNKEPIDSRISRSLPGDHRRPRSRPNSKNRLPGQ